MAPQSCFELDERSLVRRRKADAARRDPRCRRLSLAFKVGYPPPPCVASMQPAASAAASSPPPPPLRPHSTPRQPSQLPPRHPGRSAPWRCAPMHAARRIAAGVSSRLHGGAHQRCRTAVTRRPLNTRENRASVQHVQRRASLCHPRTIALVVAPPDSSSYFATNTE
eukprot:174497-Chlamydomonas_euryale.AAC.4